jgi:hypothetical protein
VKSRSMRTGGLLDVVHVHTSNEIVVEVIVATLKSDEATSKFSVRDILTRAATSSGLVIEA